MSTRLSSAQKYAQIIKACAEDHLKPPRAPNRETWDRGRHRKCGHLAAMEGFLYRLTGEKARAERAKWHIDIVLADPYLDEPWISGFGLDSASVAYDLIVDAGVMS